MPALRRDACHGEPRNNLAHCFTCKRNLNNIDLLLQLGYDFVAAVALLERWLAEYQSRRPPTKPAAQA